MNLILSVRCPLPDLGTPFLEAYAGPAESWLQPTVPARLPYNHGHIFNADGDIIQWMIDELERKRTSNRAIATLVTIKDTIGSGDGKLPSFTLLQVGFESAGESILYLTAYFRALEVSEFLPINMAEFAIIANRIADHFVDISEVYLTLHAFRAHVIDGYRAHEYALIDTITPDEIVAAVHSRAIADVVAWLEDKKRPETLIVADNLAILSEALGNQDWVPKEAVRALQSAVTKVTSLIMLRRRGSVGARITATQDAIRAELDVAVSEMLRVF